jgi:hypothetical protein
VKDAARRAAACARIAFDGKTYRRDIAWRRSRVPELPEVETIVRDLAPRLEGHRVTAARLAKTDVLRRVSKPRLLSTLKGNSFAQVTRRAKHAVFRLASGHRLVVQPRMTGSLIVHERRLTRAEAKYAVLTCTLDDGRLFVYRDVRRLGTVWLLDEDDWLAYTGRIGPEPLDETFTPFVFAQRLEARGPRSRKRSWTRSVWPASATSTRTRLCSPPGSIPRRPRPTCRSRSSRACMRR